MTIVATKASKNNNLFSVSGELTVRSIGASGTIVGGMSFNVDADSVEADVTISPIVLNTTVEQTLDITAEWSVASAGNSVRSILGTFVALI